MSIVGDREEIAAALSALDDVAGHPFRPRTLPPGTGWPMVRSLDRGPARDFEVTWTVVVVLPAEEQRASEWFDAHHEEVADSLAGFGFVDRIEPGLVATSGGDLQAMFLTVRKEA